MRIPQIVGLELMALGLATAVHATPLPTYNTMTGNGSSVSAVYIGFEAADTDTLSVVAGAQNFFVNNTTAVGATYNLGTFAPGAEIKFQLTDLSLPATFYSGAGSRNPDGEVHADVTYAPASIPGFSGLSAASQSYALNLAASNPKYDFIGFEDRSGPQSDFDYNDLVFAVLNGTPTSMPVPEPMSLALFGTALAGVGLARRKRA